MEAPNMSLIYTRSTIMKLILKSTIIAFLLLAITTANAAITVSSVKGTAAVKAGANWQPLRPGMHLNEGAMISTGFMSQAVLNMDGHIVTLRSMTMIKVYRNVLNNSASENNVGLRYGRINARVNRVGNLKTKFNVSTPVATSSVRGTEKEILYGPSFGMREWVPENEAILYSRSGIKVIVGGRSMFQLKPGALRPNPLHHALKQKSAGNIQPTYITDDERDGNALYSDQFVDNGESIADFYDSSSGADVNINILWP